MNRSVLLSLVCALALVLIPLSYSSLWAQSNSEYTQQNKTETKSVDQNTLPGDVTQDNNLNQSPSQSQSNLPQSTREKPSEVTTESQRTTTQPSQTTTESQRTTPSQTTSPESATEQQKTSDQNASNREGLPATAGELPLLALSGILSLVAAVGARSFARAKSR